RSRRPSPKRMSDFWNDRSTGVMTPAAGMRGIMVAMRARLWVRGPRNRRHRLDVPKLLSLALQVGEGAPQVILVKEVIHRVVGCRIFVRFRGLNFGAQGL